MDILKKGALDIVVLSTLEHQDRYGLEIFKSINEQTNDAFKFKTGTLYPLLHKLENNKLVTTKWAPSTSGGPKRKYYHLTSKGRKTLEKRRQEWHDFKTNIDILLKPA